MIQTLNCGGSFVTIDEQLQYLQRISTLAADMIDGAKRAFNNRN